MRIQVLNYPVPGYSYIHWTGWYGDVYTAWNRGKAAVCI